MSCKFTKFFMFAPDWWFASC